MKRVYSKYLKPRSQQVATSYEKKRAKELALLFAGRYGFPKK